MRRAVAVGLALLLAAGAAPAVAKGPFAGVAADDAVTWVASPERGLLRVVDGRVAGDVDVGEQPMAVAAGGGEAWTLTFGGGVARVAGERVEARRSLGLDAVDLAMGERSLWVLGSRGTTPAESVLLRVDRATLRVRGAFHLGPRSARLAAGGGRVWLAFDPAGSREPMGLVAIDQGAGRLAMRRRLPGSPRAMAVGRSGAWVLSSAQGGEGRLRKVAPDGAVRRSVAAPFQSGDIAVAGGRVWVTSLCGPDDCDLTGASVHAYDEETAKAVAGPFRPSCGGAWRGAFLSGIAPAGRGVALATGRPTGTGLDLVVLEAERGPVRCVPLSPDA
jgi:hypothetical protein